jgi:hypothetical protein
MKFTDADLVAMLEATGEIVTLGAASTRGVVRAADLEQLGQQDLPVQVISDALSVTVKKGSLSGLTEGSTVSIRGNTYTVDSVRDVYAGEMTRFIGFKAP